MSWYIKSKLINLQHNVDKGALNSQCMYCSRWGTHPSNVRSPKKEIIWKTNDELDFKEKEEVNRLGKQVSHGICSICLKVMQKIQEEGLNPYSESALNKIRELSLKTR